MLSNDHENALLLLEFNNTNIANIGDATGLRGSSVAGSFYVAGHTSSPGETGKQNTNEGAYTSYARKAVARSGAGFTVSGNNVVNAAAIDFPKCTGGSETWTHWSIGYELAGATNVRSYGPLIQDGAIWLPFTAKTNDTITIPGHSLSVDDRITFKTGFQGTLPTGVTEDTVYWVKTVSGDDITISATQGGSAVDITAVGSGVCIECSPINISNNITPSFAAGKLSIYSD